MASGAPPHEAWTCPPPQKLPTALHLVSGSVRGAGPTDEILGRGRSVRLLPLPSLALGWDWMLQASGHRAGSRAVWGLPTVTPRA